MGLFDDFNPVSSKAWKQKIQYDLKGVDYNNILVWNSKDGIDVKPFYHADQFEDFLKVPKRSEKHWNICQTVFVADVKKSNKKAKDLISRGANAIRFIITSRDLDVKALLKDIDVQHLLFYIECQFLSKAFIENFQRTYVELSNSPELDQLHFDLDIIGRLAKTGNWFHTLQSDHEEFGEILDISKSFSVDCRLYQNAGATIIQELAYAMAHCNEYFNHLDADVSEEKKEQIRVVFKSSVGSNYFFEIAKLRALRLLFASLASEYGFNPDCHIVATPSKRNKTLYDYNVNMLRTTTECMSAVLGGADTVNNLAYDAIYHKDNEFGERISRNQLLILKEESYFDAVNNPADGAYYIESLTEDFATKALELFKDIERNGGFLNQLKAGTIQKKIKESAEKEQQLVDSEQMVLVGTNKYPNADDRMANELELYPFVKINPVKTLIEPIIEKRLSESLEKKRLKNEND